MARKIEMKTGRLSEFRVFHIIYMFHDSLLKLPTGLTNILLRTFCTLDEIDYIT